MEHSFLSKETLTPSCNSAQVRWRNFCIFYIPIQFIEIFSSLSWCLTCQHSIKTY